MKEKTIEERWQDFHCSDWHKSIDESCKQKTLKAVRQAQKEAVMKAFEEVVPEIKQSPNPLKEDIVHNTGEQKDMLVNKGWNACRDKTLSSQKAYLKKEFGIKE